MFQINMKFVFLQEIQGDIKVVVKPAKNKEVLQREEGSQPPYPESIGTSVFREFA